ncbi:MAG: 3-hydroxyacyl-CoA dehydrogenase family protein [Nitrospinaceae bacterium]
MSVIGVGTMGRGIAQAAALAGYEVVLFDSDRPRAVEGVEIIKQNLDRLMSKEASPQSSPAPGEKVSVAENLEGVAESFLLIEAIAEDRAAKAGLFSKMDALCGAHGVMASNTSSIPITEIASHTRHPGNVIGLHFMNPVSLMKGVEIIRGLQTSDATYQKTLRFAKRLGKEPVRSADRAGFVINRILMPLINEAIALVEEGTATIEDVDKGALHCLNHAMGPLALSDLIGNDTTHHILSVLEHEFGEKFKPAPLLTRMVEAGFHGNKTGGGFYHWENNKPLRVNAALSNFLGSG